MATQAKVQVVILAGGQGARFWPISRMRRPKQFLSISANGESLIQATARRVVGLVGKENVLIVTNALHEPLIREHVPFAEVMCEPVGRNTAASIGLAAVRARRSGPDTVMIVLPADHAVRNEAELVATLKEAVAVAAAEDLLVTIGVPPSYPHTGYGYIKRSAALKGNGYLVGRFYEKPNFERAQKYCESGNFYWNSGMFVWRAEVILEALEEEMPELYAGLMRIDQVLGTPDEARVTAEVFEALEAVSIDFGVLEHSRNCAVIAAHDFGWNDVGSWDAWAEHFAPDELGNLVRGDALLIDSQNCLVHSENRLTAVLGGENLIIIDSGDALLICPRDRVQDVRRIVEELKERGRRELV
jgi:mannose-1-phosphate guanylyltransferase